jgi:hypothetical protein
MCISAINALTYIAAIPSGWKHLGVHVAEECGRMSLPRRIDLQCFVVAIRHPVSPQFLPELHRMSSSLPFDTLAVFPIDSQCPYDKSGTGPFWLMFWFA